ncbi:MAG: chorismate synthase [Nitrospirota bacterium]|nr:chorismate synthase [Nitrospirota bacterium]
MLRYLTAGESHGKLLNAILEGMPSGVPLDAAMIDADLARRQKGYGRGGRMKIEKDHVEIATGVRWGKTMGGPVGLIVQNRDWSHWLEKMAPEAEHEGCLEPFIRPRPGHADLPGILKYDHKDVRNILERSSARETTMRVAIGAVSKAILANFGIRIVSFVTEIGGVSVSVSGDYAELFEKAEASEVRCPDQEGSKRMMAAIDDAKHNGDTLGGIFEVVVTGVPAGLGSHVHWDRKLDGRLAGALMSVQAIKGVEVGIGFEVARRPGSKVHDEIFYNREGSKLAGGYYHGSNNAGGIEGGMSNGEPIRLRAAMKPIPTLTKPLRSVNIETKEPLEAAWERSDHCAVPAAGVVGEAVVAFEIARAFLDKFGGDSLQEIRRNYDGYLEQIGKG